MKDPDQLQKAIESLGGDFELIRQLGQGATAVVYLLRDHALERDVAMKVIRATFAGDDEAIARLQREARLVAQLTHPNIVKLFGTQRLDDGSFALFMEHVPGRNLKEILREEGAFPVPKTLGVLRDIASALAYAHRRRIVHRDVKPENIYIDEEVGSARLADFGVARPWDQDARLTIPGASLGTPAYMSPEQVDGQDVDGRSDVYSLGLVGYELLLGRHPWEGENVFTIIYRQKNDELPVDSLGLGDYPALAETLEQALQKDPAERLESAIAFLERLSEVDGSQPLAPSRRTGFSPGEEAFSPVNWEIVEPTADGEATVPVTADQEPEEGQEEGDRPVLGVKPKSFLRKWGVPLAAVLAVLSFGLHRWQPWSTPSVDPGDFIPVNPTPPEVEEPTSGPEEDLPVGPSGLQPVQGSFPAGQVGSLLPIEVSLTGDDGRPLVDRLVAFSVAQGNGVFEREEAMTDSLGVAQGQLRLPNRPGEMMVLAQVLGADSLRTLLPVTVEIGDPNRVISIQGDGQRGDPGAALGQALGVRVLDEFGNSVPDTEVRFQVSLGGGQVSPPVAVSDEEGRAFARWTLGGRAGVQAVAVVVPAADGAFLTFQATALVPPVTEPEPEPETPPDLDSPTPGTPRTGPVTVITKTFSVGGSQVCHLAGGVARCRGAKDRGQAGDGTLAGLVGIATGVSHACGLDASGGAWCWGANGSGQLGDGSTTDRQPAGPVSTEARFSVLAAGFSHTCGVGAGGQASCWGRNVNGQLGIGSRDDQGHPVATQGDLSFSELVAGWNHTCGISSGGAAYCWGSNSWGQVGDGTQVDRLAPTRVSGSFQALAAGRSHTCGISGSDVLCWGANGNGQLGNGSATDSPSPVSVGGLPGSPLSLAAGANHTCVVLTDRAAYCWGQNIHGQLGDGTTSDRLSPVAVAGEIAFVALYAGGGVTCAFATDGSEYCWGLNQNGQLGDGSRNNRSTPTRVGGNTP